MKNISILKGGLIGLVFGFVLLIIFASPSLQLKYLISESYLFYFPTAYISPLLSLPLYFFGGAILGFIYNKIPYKKSFAFLLLLSILIGAVLTIIIFRIPFYKNYSEQNCEANNFFSLARWNIIFNLTDCYQSVALSNKTISTCEKITNKNRQENCYQDVATELGSYVMCQKISNMDNRERCYEDVAVRLKSYEICQKVSNEVYRNECFSRIANINGECEIIPMILRDSCYLNNYEKIKISTYTSDCKYLEVKNSYLCQKLKNNKITASYFCEKIIDQKIKQQCYNY